MPRNQRLMRKMAEIGELRRGRFVRALVDFGIPRQDAGQNRRLFNRAMDRLRADEDIDDIVKLITDLFPDNVEAIANARHAKVRIELEEEHTGITNTGNGLMQGAYDLAVAEQLERDLRSWLDRYETMDDTNKRVARAKKDGIAGIQRNNLPRILEAARTFDARNSNNTFDPTTISADDLLAGLRRFNANAEEGEKANYLQRVQDAHQQEAITGFDVAAMLLFSGTDAVKQDIEDFQLKKKLATDYPSNVIGTYYRGDKRGPDAIAANGFKAFEPMTIAAARLEAKKWFGAADGTSPGTYHEDWIRNNRSDKIATGNDIGCMGYGCIGTGGANRNVYQINLAGLRIVQANQASLGEAPHANQGPALVMNADTVDAATIIGVKGESAAETTFFTSIPAGAITQVYQARDPNAGIEEGRFV